MGPVQLNATSPTAAWPSPSLDPGQGRSRPTDSGPALTLDLSPEAQAALQASESEATPPEEDAPPPEEDAISGLSKDEQAQVKAMAARDAEVRAHEQAHKAVGGALTGSITYTTEKGPDGKDYAIGGHVPIDVSPGRSPEETVQKAARIQAAALAPADPSPADKSVAAKAAQMASEARIAAADEARAESEAKLEAEQAAEEEAAAAGTEGPEQPDDTLPGASAGPQAARAAAAYQKWAA